MKKFPFIVLVFFLFTSFKKRELTWLALGDSITYLNDHQNETGNRVTRGYMTRVCERRSYIHYINQGHNGWTAVRIADSIEKLSLVKADIYTIFLGTNDWWQGRTLGRLSDYQNNSGDGTVYGSFRTIVKKLRTLNPQAKIIFIAPMQRADFVYINNPKNNAYGSYKEKNGQSLEQFAFAIDSIASYEHVPVIDLYHQKELSLPHLVKFKRLKDSQSADYKDFSYPDYIGIPFNAATDEYPYPPEAIDMTYDGLHPSDKGYEFIAHKLLKQIK
ncbi:MAG: SGNH/GDSL hydrolase family protein [Flavisolibacter sp.]